MRHGGTILLDFADGASCTPVDFDYERLGYNLVKEFSDAYLDYMTPFFGAENIYRTAINPSGAGERFVR